MQQKAIVEGKRLIEREKALEDAFRGGPVSDETLRKLLAEIEASRSALRYIHLAAHLTSPPLLTPEQIKLSMAATNCARWRIKSVPVWLREKGCMSPGELWRRAH
jgi:hypothetical protein